MKKQYSKPELTIHGNVETLTKAVGLSPVKDFIIIGGVTQNVVTDGSTNFNFKP
ncbi:MAG TPA: lasso peptide [Coleofasciculaceae cyanobacterium]